MTGSLKSEGADTVVVRELTNPERKPFVVDIFGKLPLTPQPDAAPPQIEMFEGRTDDPQVTFLTIGEEYLQHDRLALEGLSSEELQEQIHAREILARHVVTY